MACEFSSIEGVVCEEAGCESITDVTFYVTEKKKLCHDCALKKERIGLERRGRLALYCEKHDKTMDLYCKTHGEGLCVSCAMIDHRQQECKHQGIKDALLENKAKLSILKKTTVDKLELFQDYGNEIHQIKPFADHHLQTIRNEIGSQVERAIERDRAREREDADKIDKEIDAKSEQLQEEIQKLQNKIQKNNDEREKRHEENRSNSEKRRELIKDKQHILHADIQNIAQEIERKIGELEKAWQDDTKAREKAKEILVRILEDDISIVKDGQRVNASLSEELKEQLDGREVEELIRVISGVRFVEGVGREKYDGRIDGYDGEWKLIDTINVRDKINYPRIVGCVNKNQVMITNGPASEEHCNTYILDLNSKNTKRVIIGNRMSWVITCAVLNDGTVVCGRYIIGCTEDSLPGCISVYDRQWNHISDVTIPRNTVNNYTWVGVEADPNGTIIAAEGSQSKIYAINMDNPADATIINTITCQEKMRMSGVLSSGHIIARTASFDRRVRIINREGDHREISHTDVIYNVCVDRMTDDLYVVTSDDEYKTCVIDQVTSGGDVRKRRVTSFPLSVRLTRANRPAHIVASRVTMTSSGNMLACDGDNILIFKKRFIL
ncbi:uncharacterized protein LOC121426489 [Lytechinus variegatus]|uniref:uncharacterized protein LOC121426489 n=1 Tax=Lytechinus variegatus TaxID=7654 RepID=UPI001BB19B6F|nr:uncharacterized protein LOC121426489 [Lytechinus variegatus]